MSEEGESPPPEDKAPAQSWQPSIPQHPSPPPPAPSEVPPEEDQPPPETTNKNEFKNQPQEAESTTERPKLKGLDPPKSIFHSQRKARVEGPEEVVAADANNSDSDDAYQRRLLMDSSSPWKNQPSTRPPLRKGFRRSR